MSSNIQISMINTRGRVVWIEESRVKALREEGWRVIVNPKENYYPQYDQAIAKVKEDQFGNSTRVLENDGYGDVLGIVVL